MRVVVCVCTRAHVCVCGKEGREGKEHREKKNEVMILLLYFPNDPLIFREFKEY